MAIDLKSCPCCSGKPILWYCTPDGKHIASGVVQRWGLMTDHHLIRCQKCGLQTKVFATKKGCVNSWNRRTDDGT